MRGAVARAVLGLALIAMSRTAAAQQNSTAFSIERFTPPPGAHALLSTDEPVVLDHLQLSFAAFGSLMSRPIVLRRVGAGEGEVSVPVERRFGVDLLAAIGLGERYQVGVGLPVVLGQTGDRLAGIGFDERALAAFAVGDLRLHAKLRVGGDRYRERGLSTAVAATLTVPTGDQDHFAGEAGEVIGVGLIGGWRERRWRVAANVGARFRTQDVVLFSPSRPHTNELVASLAAAVVVPKIADERLEVAIEGAKVFGDCRDKSGGECVVRGYSPAEVRFGIRALVSETWTVEAGAGFGTTPDEVGSPEWRAVAGVRGVLPLVAPSGPAPAAPTASSL